MLTTGGISLSKWCQQIGRGRTTVYRWRERGWLETIVIAGRHYITADEESRFWTRAAAGEFEGADDGVALENEG